MEIEMFTDERQRAIEIHVNMGREVSIYQKYPELQDSSLDSSVAFLPLTVLQDILDFCEECQQHLKITVNGIKITEYSITFSCGNMQITACFDLQEFVSIKNSFPDADGTTFRSQISCLLLVALRKAIAFGKKCEQEIKAKAAQSVAGSLTLQNETQSF